MSFFSPQRSHPTAPSQSDKRLTVGLFFLVFAIYTFTYVGAFKSNDERALFSGIDSFVKRGEFTVNQIYWDYTNVGMLTSKGDMVPNYEPGQMLLGIPFYLWGRALHGAVQGTLVFNILITALSVVLLYLILLTLRCGRRTAMLAALVYAFATLAWPYSRTFFREPLTVLAYLLAVYALLRYRAASQRQLRWPALAGFGLGLALITKQTSVALIPSLLILAFAYEYKRPADDDSSLARQRMFAFLAAVIPLALILLVQRVYNYTTLSGVELFARNIVEYTTNPQLSQSVPIRMLRALTGLSISPYKGLFWYAPVLLLGLIGAIPFTKRFRWEGLAFLLLVFLHFLGYSRYNYWSGGVAWGSRYMLPVIPFLVILSAPIFAWLTRDGATDAPRPDSTSHTSFWSQPAVQVVLRIGTWLLIALSVFIQILGVSVDLRTYELQFLLDNAKIWGGIGEAIEALYLKPSYSPVVGHLKLLLSGSQPLDFAWVQLREMGTWALVPAGLLLSLAFVLIAIIAFAMVWRRPQRSRLVGWTMAGVTVVVMSILLTIYNHGDARFDSYGVDAFLRPMMARLQDVDCGWHGCDEVLIVPDPVLTDYFLNYLSAPIVWYDIEPKPVDEDLLSKLDARYARIWLARDRNAATDDAEGRRGTEIYLVEHAYKLDEERFQDWARLLQFSAAGEIRAHVQPKQQLGDMMLRDATVGVEQVPKENDDQPAVSNQDAVFIRPGDTLQLSLHWQALEQPEGNYTVFTQVLNPGMQVVAQKDRWPGDGLYPTAALQAGQVITDNLALELPDDLPAGDYMLITGMYRPDIEGYRRLSGPNGDFVLLTRLRVEHE